MYKPTKTTIAMKQAAQPVEVVEGEQVSFQGYLGETIIPGVPLVATTSLRVGEWAIQEVNSYNEHHAAFLTQIIRWLRGKATVRDNPLLVRTCNFYLATAAGECDDLDFGDLIEVRGVALKAKGSSVVWGCIPTMVRKVPK